MTNHNEFTSLDVQVGPRHLPGVLTLPRDAFGLVLFAHGSGSSRHSARNQFVARQMHEMRLGTLLFDLLNEDEAEDRDKVFDISLLARRLGDAMDWAAGRDDVSELPQLLFGASTGAAAALVAAAKYGDRIAAVVSRGGRPDLAESYLRRVQAPTLLIVGGNDGPVVDMNEEALRALHCEKRLEIIPGATHLFPEPGALETVADLAGDWFRRHLLHAASQRESTARR